MALPTIAVTPGVGQTINTLPNGGQALGASSLPVVIASDQSPMLVYNPDTVYATANITAADVGSTTTTAGDANLQPLITGTPTAGSAAIFAVTAMDTATFEVSNAAGAGPLYAEKSVDGGVEYVQTGIAQDGVSNVGNGLTGNFVGEINCSGATHVRIRAPSWTSGTVVVGMTATKNPRVVKVSNALSLQDPTTPTNKLAINAAGQIGLAAGMNSIGSVQPLTYAPAVWAGTSFDARLYTNVTIWITTAATTAYVVQSGPDGTAWSNISGIDLLYNQQTQIAVGYLGAITVKGGGYIKVISGAGAVFQISASQ